MEHPAETGEPCAIFGLDMQFTFQPRWFRRAGVKSDIVPMYKPASVDVLQERKGRESYQAGAGTGVPHRSCAAVTSKDNLLLDPY